MKNRKKETPIPLMNEGLGELMCRRHFFIGKFDFGDRKKKRMFTEHTLDKVKKRCTCPTIQEKIKKLKNIKAFFSKIVI